MAHERKRPMGQVRAWTAALVIALASIAVAAPSSAVALPSDFWGVSPQATPTVEQFQRLHTGGVDSVRVPIPWSSVEPAPGVTNFANVDALISGAAQSGIDVLPFVYEAPAWAVARAAVPGSHGGATAPKTLPVKTGAQRAYWTAFLQKIVGRYGPSGSFWAANPGLTERPIRTWQIWNEQNFKYFVARPSPADYGKLINVSYAAVKSVDPGAKLILGGMFAQPNEATFKAKPPQAYFAVDFLDQLYETTPGIKRKFSGVALHPYTSRYQKLTPDIEEFRAVLAFNHDAGKPLWITEVGWSSERPDPAHDAFAKGPAGQAAQLRGAFKLFKQKQAKWKLQRVYWFSVDDQAGSCNFCGGSGLFGNGFLPKKSWFEYVKFAGGQPG